MIAADPSLSPVIPKKDVYLFGVPYWNPTYEEFHAWWLARLTDSVTPFQILALANPNTMNLGFSVPGYMDILKQCDVFVNDGVGIRMAAKMRGVEMKYNFAGTDLMPRLFADQPADRPCTAFYYGAREECNEGAVRIFGERYPNVKIVGRINGFVDPVKEALPRIQDSGADILMCALGQPRQEFFMVEHRNEIPCKVGVTCGAMFDFFSGNVKRAPSLFRAMRAEWVYRLAIEPGRMWRRYVVGNPAFLGRAMKWKQRDLELMKNNN